MDRRSFLAQAAGRRTTGRRRDRRRPTAPSSLRATAVSETTVALAWKAARDNVGVAKYEVLRDGRRVAFTKKRTFVDRRLRAGVAYAYRVRALDAARNIGPATRPLRVTTRPRPNGGGSSGPGPTTSAPPPPAPPPPGGGTPSNPLSTAMVDRVFWRAGFGPSDADRASWTGRSMDELVDWFLSTPNSLRTTSTPPTYNGNPIDPLATDDELVMDWLDRMQRSVNPLVERMTFFWHRHWAVSRDAGIPAQWLLSYANRLRGYADLGANPNASFRQLALDMTTADGAMSYFLTGFSNVKGHPNENYAREFMELFCLGVVDAAGNANYTQTDVEELARAFTGYQLDWEPSSPTYGGVSFDASEFDPGTKTILGHTGAYNAPAAVDIVLGHANHAPYLVRKLWKEFVFTPIPQATLDDLVATYLGSGFLLRPLLKKILTNPLIFESLDEPNLVKPPVQFTVGVLKAMDAPLRDWWQADSLDLMQQVPYTPPNVAGWEGGLSWLNTNTVQARFDLIVRCQQLKYASPNSPIADVPGETAQQAFDRAFVEVGSPWLSPQTRSLLLTYSQQAPTTTVGQRRERQYALRAFMLGGPDAQVT
ncbi:MAG: hypothetical protein QOD76_33 [Solirubrobacteraceae bacterium]|jgi:uncharacterized protein (DUF1800 family)|nr:hypothetical protein [Solirubrobacteraceae bacterium]